MEVCQVCTNEEWVEGGNPKSHFSFSNKTEITNFHHHF